MTQAEDTGGAREGVGGWAPLVPRHTHTHTLSACRRRLCSRVIMGHPITAAAEEEEPYSLLDVLYGTL